jgi:RNA polymerase sigma-70 factor (ECF subfamily)
MACLAFVSKPVAPPETTAIIAPPLLWYKFGHQSPNFAAAPVSFMVSADDDSLLVARCLGGDTAAFRPLVERYQRLLFTVALRMLGNRDEAVDAAQTAFVRAFEKLASYDRKHKFFSWLYRILVNECLNVRRNRRPEEPLSPMLVARDDPRNDAEAAERRAMVQAAVARLPRLHREVIVLRHFAEMSYQEIAGVLSVPESTVKSRLYEARQQLGQWLLGWK